MSYYEQLYGEIDDYCTLFEIIKNYINPNEFFFVIILIQFFLK